ncbi:MAG: four helix bundle protein [Crocinitomicaceae bacterium]|nr:four helix bundle protein [Crocinitomicaceae bacterium]
MKPNIQERTEDFAVDIILFCKKLFQSKIGSILGNQLIRSGTSIGANVYEAQNAQSHADFIHKMSISQKESSETSYWLRLLKRTQLAEEMETKKLLQESNEIHKVVSAIVVSAKRNKSAKNKH